MIKPPGGAKTFLPNPNFMDEFRSEDQTKAGMKVAANAAKQEAATLTPHGDTGATARSYEVVEVDGRIYLTNTDPFFHLTEFGSVNNPAYAPMRRGIQSAGMTLAEATEGLSLIV